MIRVLLVDDQDLVRAGLRMLIDSACDMVVAGEARDGSSALRLANDTAPDVVLMDIRMPVMDGITATRLLLEQRPVTKVVVLTTFGDDEYLYPALAAGASGFLTKDSEPGQLLDAIRRASDGENPYSAEILRRLVESAVRAHHAPEPGIQLPELTERERDVLALLGKGRSNREIAAELHIGVTTVKTHVSHLMERTGSRNRVQLALLAAQTIPDQATTRNP